MYGLFGSRIGQQRRPHLMREQPHSLPQQLPQPAPQQEQSRGLGSRLFGQGWEGKAGAIGAMLMGDRNAVSRYQYGQQQQEQQRLAAMQQQAADMRERALDREDFMFEQDYRRENPMPSAPDAFERALAGAGIDPTSEQGQALFRSRAESMARDPNDEFVVVPIPGRGTYAGPRSGLEQAMGQGGRPSRPVGGLRPQGGPASVPGTFQQ